MSRWPPKWDARWIWWTRHGEPQVDPEAVPTGPDEIGFLRRSFEIPQTPVRFEARVSANSRYILFVNGERVGSGPVRSDPLRWTFDTYDLAHLVRPGSNSLAAWCRHYGRQNVFWRPSRRSGEVGWGWFLFEGAIELPSGETVGIASDERWRALPGPYRRHVPGIWQAAQPVTEIIEGERLPSGFESPDFDDSDWPAALVLTWQGLGPQVETPPADPHSLLHPRPIPQLAERPIHPRSVCGAGKISVRLTDDPLADFYDGRAAPAEAPAESGEIFLTEGGFVTFDFGRITRARPRLRVSAPAGTVFDLAAGEDLDQHGGPVILPREWVLRYHARGSEGEEFESFEAIGFRYLSVRASGPATLHQVGATETHYPRPAGAYFRCDDEVLNSIWETGVRTLDLCSTDAFIDCPGREQRAWLGDAFLTSLISLVANPDPHLVLWNLRLHAQGRRPDGLLPAAAACDIAMREGTIPDFSLHFVRGLARVWEYLGDVGLVDELLPVARSILDWFGAFRGDDDVLRDVPGWVFIDWAQTERGRQTAALDALYVLALEDYATLLRSRGDRASEARGIARSVRKGFARYFDRRRGVYVDAADPEKGPGARVSQQTNALAVLARCAPPRRIPGILDRILDPRRTRLTKTPGDSLDWGERLGFQWEPPTDFDLENDVVAAQPFFAHFVHQAVAVAGKRALLPDLLRRWEKQLASGNGCFEEYWEAPPGGGSRCHVWSATPVYDLTTHILGVRPSAPGFTETAVEPFFGPLRQLAGAVPTPHGFIEVDAERGPGAPRGTITLPPGTKATVRFEEFEDHGVRVVQGPGTFDL